MSRFASWRAGRQNGSRRTVRAGRWRTGSGRVTPTPVLLPDAANRLGDGVVVETTLVARLLGLRILRVEGTVLLSPGRLVDGSPHIIDGTTTTLAGPATAEDDTLARASRLLRENGEQLRRLR